MILGIYEDSQKEPLTFGNPRMPTEIRSKRPEVHGPGRVELVVCGQLHDEA